MMNEGVVVVRLRRLRKNENIRNMLQESRIQISDFVYPLFVVEGNNVKNEIKSMPDVYQMSIDNILQECENLRNLGISHIILFGIPAIKDSIGSSALSDKSIISRAVRAIKERFNDMVVSVDLCFCEYTDHGHCGILDSNGDVNNDKTLEILARQAVILADSGADIIAPSAMMDGQIRAIRDSLDANKFINTLIMSYSTKFASAFYGPFRDVADSAPSFGDRKTYQQNPANRNEAIRESLIDEDEGADILMVKPVLSYLDIVRDIKENSLLPLAVYNVSGEYAMLRATKNAGLIDYDRTLLEMMISFKRAGADIIISYHAKEIANLI